MTIKMKHMKHYESILEAAFADITPDRHCVPAFTSDAAMHLGESNGATAAFTAATVDLQRPCAAGRVRIDTGRVIAFENMAATNPPQ